MKGIPTRKNLVESMLQFILAEDRATLDGVNFFMLKNFGIKFDATAKYIAECSLAGFLIVEQGKFRVTSRWKQLTGNNIKN